MIFSTCILFRWELFPSLMILDLSLKVNLHISNVDAGLLLAIVSFSSFLNVLRNFFNYVFHFPFFFVSFLKNLYKVSVYISALMQSLSHFKVIPKIVQFPRFSQAPALLFSSETSPLNNEDSASVSTKRKESNKLAICKDPHKIVLRRKNLQVFENGHSFKLLLILYLTYLPGESLLMELALNIKTTWWGFCERLEIFDYRMQQKLILYIVFSVMHEIDILISWFYWVDAKIQSIMILADSHFNSFIRKRVTVPLKNLVGEYLLKQFSYLRTFTISSQHIVGSYCLNFFLLKRTWIDWNIFSKIFQFPWINIKHRNYHTSLPTNIFRYWSQRKELHLVKDYRKLISSNDIGAWWYCYST